jgi:hypothetical protein
VDVQNQKENEMSNIRTLLESMRNIEEVGPTKAPETFRITIPQGGRTSFTKAVRQILGKDSIFDSGYSDGSTLWNIAASNTKKLPVRAFEDKLRKVMNYDAWLEVADFEAVRETTVQEDSFDAPEPRSKGKSMGGGVKDLPDIKSSDGQYTVKCWKEMETDNETYWFKIYGPDIDSDGIAINWSERTLPVKFVDMWIKLFKKVPEQMKKFSSHRLYAKELENLYQQYSVNEGLLDMFKKKPQRGRLDRPSADAMTNPGSDRVFQSQHINDIDPDDVPEFKSSWRTTT